MRKAAAGAWRLPPAVAAWAGAEVGLPPPESRPGGVPRVGRLPRRVRGRPQPLLQRRNYTEALSVPRRPALPLSLPLLTSTASLASEFLIVPFLLVVFNILLRGIFVCLFVLMIFILLARFWLELFKFDPDIL